MINKNVQDDDLALVKAGDRAEDAEAPFGGDRVRNELLRGTDQIGCYGERSQRG